jgi:hypothetical protein
MTTKMRAKLFINTVLEQFNGPEQAKSMEVLSMNVVARSTPYPADGLDEDNSFAKWSPIVALQIHIANPALWGQFKSGQKFYADFTEAE